MESFAPALIFFLLLGVGLHFLGSHIINGKKGELAIKKVIGQLGLRKIARGQHKARYSGKVQGSLLLLEKRVLSQGQEVWRISVESEHLAEGIKLFSQDWHRHNEEHSGVESDLCIGDPIFDQNFIIQGSSVEIAKFLIPVTRHQLSGICDNCTSISVMNGKVSLTLTSLPNSEAKILDKFILATQLAQRERVQIPPENMLAEQVMSESNGAIRAYLLNTLANEDKKGTLTQDTARQALQQYQDPDTQLAAAAILGKEALSTVLEVLMTAPRDYQLSSIALLKPFVTQEDVTDVLKGALSNPGSDVAYAAAMALGDGNIRALAQFMTPDRWDTVHRRTLVALAQRLEEYPYPGAEDQLIKMLERDDDELLEHAVSALRRVGTARAVEPLMVLADGFGKYDLRSNATTAISTIQNRISIQDAGGLSLADQGPTGGSLSIQNNRGQLSEVEKAEAGVEEGA
jgi:hypothetical protein